MKRIRIELTGTTRGKACQTRRLYLSFPGLSIKKIEPDDLLLDALHLLCDFEAKHFWGYLTYSLKCRNHVASDTEPMPE